MNISVGNLVEDGYEFCGVNRRVPAGLCTTAAGQIIANACGALLGLLAFVMRKSTF